MRQPRIMALAMNMLAAAIISFRNAPAKVNIIYG
jgi:hypothetical protein